MGDRTRALRDGGSSTAIPEVTLSRGVAFMLLFKPLPQPDPYGDSAIRPGSQNSKAQECDNHAHQGPE